MLIDLIYRRCDSQARGWWKGKPWLVIRIRRRAYNHQICDFQEVGEAVVHTIEAAEKVMDAVQNGVSLAQSLGHAIANGEELNQVTAQVVQIKDDFVKRWPWVNPAMWERTAVEIKGGLCRSVGDILHEPRGRSSQSN